MIAFSDPDDVFLDMTSLQDEIYMLVQKQLACPDLWYATELTYDDLYI
jgi:hypothetical protein